MRIITVDIPRQEAITKDRVPIGVNAAVYFRIRACEDVVLKVKHYPYAFPNIPWLL